MISERINALLSFYGLQTHDFPNGRGSHSSLDHLDTVAKLCTKNDVVGVRVRMHETRLHWLKNGLFFHLGEQNENELVVGDWQDLPNQLSCQNKRRVH